MTENTDLHGDDDRAEVASAEVNSVDDETDRRVDDAGSQDSRGLEGHNSTDEEPDTFPREYVEKLRDENARYRQRAGKADELSKRVHRLMVERTGRLADPDDLAFDEEHLDDEDALTAALDDLLAHKPHLAARRPRGDIGQGIGDSGPTDLAAILRRAAN